jgi:acyl-CoA hydrolase
MQVDVRTASRRLSSPARSNDAEMDHPETQIVERRTELVFPHETNQYGTLFGGRALAMMDVVASIAAMRASRKPVVTASIDRTDFKAPIRVGELVETIARVVRIGRTSITVDVELWAEHPVEGNRRLSTVGRFVMVAVGPDGRPTPVRDEPSPP